MTNALQATRPLHSPPVGVPRLAALTARLIAKLGCPQCTSL